MIKTIYIKGMGIVHSDGARGLRDAQALPDAAPVVDGKVPLPAFPLERFVSKVRDLNAMGPGQKMLVCAAGMALEDAGLQGDARQSCDLYMAAKIGERNDAVDAAILAGAGRDDFDINSELARLRPTHFLAELPNLYAANIAMLLALKGESLTFVGEAAASVQAVIHALEKLGSGRTNNVLAGGVFNGDQLMHDEYRRGAAGQLLGVFGTAACCMVLDREPAGALASLRRAGPVQREQVDEQLARSEAALLVVHGFTAGRGWIQSLQVSVPVLDVESMMGQLHEATLPVQVYLAALALRARTIAGPKRAMLLVQIGLERYETFILDVF
ncbi:3-oxoacyl-(acyl-carrier-protein) synthase [Pseudomonas hunanensis]|uniref:3-oxoacyl-(Acyl-carrier-protein) synthase n=1 Tax=Pseudomonas hunanensis TaxID=1247546 RepID=A0ACC6K9K8_9PSED|nr:beta-ketoacyl synthase N-terminal-like domain-containing protein [Pseudomonas hunanensis]MDR6715183.1 3-oxoacyl-(acyl-carrier-protein) synthase [Pseudomonas hunanensis]